MALERGLLKDFHDSLDKRLLQDLLYPLDRRLLDDFLAGPRQEVSERIRCMLPRQGQFEGNRGFGVLPRQAASEATRFCVIFWGPR